MNRRAVPLFLLSPLLLLGVSTPPPPPAGIVERQIEQEYDAEEVSPQKQVPLLEIDIPEKQLELGTETVEVKAVVFTGSTVFSDKKLQKMAAPYLGKELSMQEIHELCEKIQKRYAERGYFLARVYIPEQEVKNGVLHLTIIEGTLGTVKVIGPKYYKERFIAGYFKKFEGKPLNYDDILKTLLLLDEHMDLEVGAIFKKGQEYGTADLIVQAKDSRPIHLGFDHNNYGSDYTSRQRSGAKLDWGNLFVNGDVLRITQVMGTPFSSLDFTDGVYQFPLNTSGSVLEMGYLFAKFVTRDVEKDLKYKGYSHIATLKWDQAMHRTRKLNTDFFTQFDYKQIQNFGNNTESSYDHLRVLTAGLKVDYIDGWKGRNLIHTSVGWGIPDILGGSRVVSEGGSRVGAGGRFVKLNGGYKRMQMIPYDCFLLLNAEGQYSFDKLPLPEQIYIGGIETVRGYKLAEGLGDQGFYGSVELRVPPPWLRGKKLPWSKKRWGEFLQFVGFLDFGQTFSIGQDEINEIVLNEDNQTEREAVKQNGRAILTSVGCGVRVYGPWKFEFSLDAGYPLTEKHRSSNTIVYYRLMLNLL